LIGNLQILRAFAATGVVFLHSHATVFGVHTEFYGVALFFVLSGYLMSRISNRSAREFAIDRFWRIVPAYWLATALMLTTFGMWTYWPAWHVILSFLFVPHVSPGGLHPVLGVGWTLVFEVYFYAIFAVAILINRKFAPVIAAGLVGCIFFTIPAVISSEALNFYYGGRPIWFFVAGIGIWYFTEHFKAAWSRREFKKHWFAWGLGAYALASVVTGAIWPEPEEAFWAALVLTTLLFSLAVLMAQGGADQKPPYLVLLGNASYGCYLIHTIFIELMRHRGIAIDGSLITTAIILVSSWTLAVVWYLTVEKAIVLLKRRFTA
jgi:exopolysaccharide production protein ExoZ